MYPNPQEALPLTPRPNLEQYRKLAKDLVKACRSGDAGAVRAWAAAWVGQLARRWPGLKTLDNETNIKRHADAVGEFAHAQLSAGPSKKCALATAQFVIARAHGFLSWPKFVKHLESLGRSNSPVAAFERAVSAVVAGDTVTLKRLLREHPTLARAESMREHRATLLHYVSANGVEGYHQVSPNNSAEIAEILLNAGADVDATSDVYQGKCTPLGLVATSSPPFDAGVQRDVIEVLLARGARMDLRGSVGHDSSLVRGCLANGQPQAAEYLASRGAPVGLVEAAGLGDVDRVRELAPGTATSKLREAFSMACAYGRVGVVEFLLANGVGVDDESRGFGEGHTGLHVAAYQGHLELVTTLLRHGASVDAIDKTWQTTPLTWALTGWERHPSPHHYDIVAALVTAGAAVTADMLEWDKARADARMTSALQRRTER
jgi:Ankyrin repeats (3 copies)